MSIGVIYIPVDGNIYIKSHSNTELFNNIGNFVSISKNDKLDTLSLYENDKHLYELIVNDNKENQSVNKFASKLRNEEIIGNVVLIKESVDGIESIDDLNILNEIEFNLNNIKFVEIDGNNLKQHICLKTDLNKKIQEFLNTSTQIKKSCVFNYKLFGYSFEIYSKHDIELEENANANQLLPSIVKSEDIKEYVSTFKKSTAKSTAKSTKEVDKEADEEADEEAKKKEKEQNTIYGKAFIINKDNKNFVNITVNEIKQLLLISKKNMKDIDSEYYNTYIKFLINLNNKTDNVEETFIVKNRIKTLNDIYNKAIHC